MSSKDIPQQDDIFGAYDRKYSVAVEKNYNFEPPNVYEFPQYKAPVLPTPVRQEGIDFPGDQVVGSTTFNVNDLIAKGLFDAAEYFLGRKLTATERQEGLGLVANSDASRKQKRDKDAIDILTQIMEKLPGLKEESKEVKKKDKDQDEEDPEEEDEDPDEEDDSEKDVTRKLSFQESDDESVATTVRGRDRQRDGEEKEDHEDDAESVATTVKDGTSGLAGKYKGDDLVPRYNPDKLYSTEEARAIIGEWRQDNQALKGNWPSNSLLFGILPKQKNKAAYNKWLKDTQAEIIQVKQSLAVVPDAPAIPDAPEVTVQAQGPLKRGLDLNEVRKRRTLKPTPERVAPTNVIDEIRKGTKLTPARPLRPSNVADEVTPIQKKANEALDAIKNRRSAIADDDEWEEQEPPLTVIKKGKGLLPMKKPSGRKPADWVSFGRYLIAADKLRDEDLVAIVSAHNHMKLNRMPNKTVSTGLKICLTEQLAGRPMPVELLNDDEKVWLDWLLHECGIKMKKQPVSDLAIKRTPKALKDRLAVLYGEIAEGPNDNPALATELKVLFNQALLRGILSDQQIINLREFIQTLQ